ncbi:hypothetical protein BU26DRAFT_584416 [Trematosphaeria pertusa]|uniref:Uncharacterized protein n=1 Tax=Trematosphaeria pertusa TaxID=390896 RepID=A0A6A6HVY5_9PLEO|nr:uncharacterized protein BU26DRAFT_584416 [Trematosphaeria pertusa]KAF2242256.1 hypothetical protein BU26DRAFT_584416 [Trematosphaeria pertusa]
MDTPQPNNQTVGWMPEAYHDRGTASLLYSNLITLFLCSWSAVHLNVPADEDSCIMIKLRKIKWMMVAILAPEFVATAAFRDWRYARNWMEEFDTWKDIRRYWEKIHDRWTMTHAFFLEMGGLAIELPSGVRVRMLKSPDGDHGFRELMDRGMELPFISEEDVQDKSKASWLIKAIAFGQIAWFATEIGARYGQGLLIAPLELFTLAIVVCTLISYVFMVEQTARCREASDHYTPRDASKGFPTKTQKAPNKTSLLPGR